MSNSKEQISSLLAAEYVLGTLNSSTRRRYQKLMMQSTKTRELTNMWEQRLNEMGEAIPPIKPREIVRERIYAQLGFCEKAEETQMITWLERVHPLSVLATAAMLLLTIYIGINANFSDPGVAHPIQTAVFQSDGEPLWLVNVDEDRLQIIATSRLEKHKEKDYELWMLNTAGDAPISLGVLPQIGSIYIKRTAQFNLFNVDKLAVSIEEKGGSKSGVPGEVLYITDLVDV